MSITVDPAYAAALADDVPGALDDCFISPGEAAAGTLQRTARGRAARGAGGQRAARRGSEGKRGHRPRVLLLIGARVLQTRRRQLCSWRSARALRTRRVST